MRFLVTGASGFAGRHLCRLLRSSGYEVVTLGTSSGEDFPVDIRAASDLISAFAEARPNGVFHLAGLAFVPQGEEKSGLAEAVNHGGTRNVLNAARAVGARSLVVSSGAVYGPLSASELPATEALPLAPQGAYACSKASAEQECLQRASEQEIVRVRPFNHTGPGQQRGFVCSDFASQIAACEAGKREAKIEVGDLRAERDFCDVRDVVAGYLLAWQHGRVGDVYNICSGRPLAIACILDMLLALARVRIDISVRQERFRPGEVSSYHGSFAKFRAVTGWRPEILLERTLADLMEYWRRRLREDGC